MSSCWSSGKDVLQQNLADDDSVERLAYAPDSRTHSSTVAIRRSRRRRNQKNLGHFAECGLHLLQRLRLLNQGRDNLLLDEFHHVLQTTDFVGRQHSCPKLLARTHVVLVGFEQMCKVKAPPVVIRERLGLRRR